MTGASISFFLPVAVRAVQTLPSRSIGERRKGETGQSDTSVYSARSADFVFLLVNSRRIFIGNNSSDGVKDNEWQMAPMASTEMPSLSNISTGRATRRSRRQVVESQNSRPQRRKSIDARGGRRIGADAILGPALRRRSISRTQLVAVFRHVVVRSKSACCQ